MLHRHQHLINGRTENEYQWAVHELYIGSEDNPDLSWTAEPIALTGDTSVELAQTLSLIAHDTRRRPWLDLTGELPRLRDALDDVDPRTVLVAVTQTCRAAPTQFTARAADGTVLYLRYRHGRGTVTVDHGRYGLGDRIADFRIDIADDPGVIELGDFCARAGLILDTDCQISLMEPELLDELCDDLLDH